MKTLNSIRFALLAAAILSTQTAFAAGKPGPTSPPPPPPSSGTLVLAYPNAANWGLVAAPPGRIFAAGNSYATRSQLVLGSSTDGSSWSILDDFAAPERTVDFWGGLGGGIASDSLGNLYASGLAYDDNLIQPNVWYARRSTDGGATWTTVDDYVTAAAWWGADDIGIATDAAGDVYVSGWNGAAWTVRKGIGGASFSTVDFLPNSYPKDIFVHPTAGIFVVGQTQITIRNVTSWAWLVRRSTDGGATWLNVDTFQLSSSSPSVAWGISADASGNLYVVGSGNVLNKGTSHWIVRKSTNGGNSWGTVDNYQLAADNYSSARCILADAYGNLWVAGRGDQGASDGTFRNRHWVVRKSVGGSSPWTTVDVFQNGGGGTTPNAIAADVFGNVFVGGDDGDNWLIKKY